MSTVQPEGTSAPIVGATNPHRSVLRLILQPRIVKAALKVSLVVGTILNVINNGEQFWVHHTVGFWQLAMNFVVPYCVSSYSAACNEAQRGWGN